MTFSTDFYFQKMHKMTLVMAFLETWKKYVFFNKIIVFLLLLNMQILQDDAPSLRKTESI